MQILAVLEWKKWSCRSSKTFQQATCRKGLDSRLTAVRTSLIQGCQSIFAKKYCAICAAPLSLLEHLIWDKCGQPRMEHKETAHQMKLKSASWCGGQQQTLLWPLKNLLSKTHCKSQSTLVAVYGHNCLYTENMLISSFSVISDTVPAPAVNML